jgi:hypothetical protein
MAKIPRARARRKRTTTAKNDQRCGNKNIFRRLLMLETLHFFSETSCLGPSFGREISETQMETPIPRKKLKL